MQKIHVVDGRVNIGGTKLSLTMGQFADMKRNLKSVQHQASGLNGSRAQARRAKQIAKIAAKNDATMDAIFQAVERVTPKT